MELWKKGYTVIGVDEVGRGAFAGPLVVAGVIFSPTTSEKRLATLLSYGINDSKKLSANRRKLLSEVIQKESLAYHISVIEVTQINRIGIGKATFCAMRMVVKNLVLSGQLSMVNGQLFKPYVLVDGFYIKHLKNVGLKNQKGIVGGDTISLSIAAASIIAKVFRDEHMTKLSAKHPGFDWSKNKGYGTLFHRNAIQKYGHTELHRKDFVRRFITLGL